MCPRYTALLFFVILCSPYVTDAFHPPRNVARHKIGSNINRFRRLSNIQNNIPIINKVRLRDVLAVFIGLRVLYYTYDEISDIVSTIDVIGQSNYKKVIELFDIMHVVNVLNVLTILEACDMAEGLRRCCTRMIGFRKNRMRIWTRRFRTWTDSM